MPEIELALLSPFMTSALILAIVMLLWDTIEVGRNDAANIVNSVFGARILTRRAAIFIAGIGVILGAYLSSDVIETARKGIFTPSHFSIEQALAIYVSVYIVDTVLLYTYSAFGMPVSTTMTLVFELLGAALFLGMMNSDANAVNWPKAGKVILGIVCSILLSGIMGFFLQRACRGAIREKWKSMGTLLLHGGWVGGGLMAGLTYFMLVKGMKNVGVIKDLKENLLSHEYGGMVAFFVLWTVYSVIIHMCLVIFRKKAARLLFPVLTVIGMFAMAFAFGQNDLANCASPGLAAVKLIEGSQQGLSIADISKVPIAPLWLLACGCLLVLGMGTKNAERVTKAEVRTGSRTESHVKLYAPQWCIRLAEVFTRWRSKDSFPLSSTHKPEEGHTKHYDPLRACIIVSVSASVIATASALGLPVSTTYVAFAAVIATGIADRIYTRGEASLKLGRSIWVVFSWFAAAVMALVASGLVCLAIFYVGITGMITCLVVNLIIRHIMKKRADLQEQRLREEERRLYG
jgi:phosphate/sulfate permease